MAIAIKHIQEEFPSPRDYVPEIPVCVEQIVFKCCQKSPDRRYQSMSELIVDLKQSLISPDEDFVKVADPDEEASTRMITDKDMVQIKRQSENRDSMDEAMRLKKDVRDRERVRSYEEDEDEDWEDDEEDYDPKMEKITTILAVVAALLIGCILIFIVGRAMGVFSFDGQRTQENQEQETEQVEMIRVVGMHVDEAKRKLLELELSPEIKYEESSSYDAGTVLRASVQDGLMIDKGTTIVLTVAEAAEGVEVPDAAGKSQTEATSILEKEGFVVNVVESYDPQVEKGIVISQSPEAGTTASAGSSITIRVSQGADDNKVRVPDVVGMTEMDATATLAESGLPVGNVTETPHEDPNLAGMVCYQSYSVGSYVDKGTPVDLRISTGPSQTTYKYAEGITAPTEEPSYQSGMQVTVTLTAGDGTQLLNTQTTTFPVGVNYTGIKSATGTIRYTFTVQTEPTTITDPETGETTTEGGGTETKTVERKVNFVEE